MTTDTCFLDVLSKVQPLRMLLSLCLIFYNFQFGAAYKSVASKKKCVTGPQISCTYFFRFISIFTLSQILRTDLAICFSRIRLQKDVFVSEQNKTRQKFKFK